MGSKTEIIIVENERRQLRLANLKEVLSNYFIIPSFQRPYAWNSDNFEDLLSTLNENKEADREAFFGSIIAVEHQGSIRKYHLIDGQQRITSFLMLIKFIKIRLEGRAQNIDDELKKLQKSVKEAKAKKDVDLLEEKLELLNNHKKDKEWCNQTIENIRNHLTRNRISREHDSNPDLQDERAILGYLSSNDSGPNTEIKNAMKKFDNALQDDVEDIRNFLAYLYEKCTFCFLVIKGDGAEDHAIDIFNSLNSTGEPLTAFEILKSSLSKKEDKNIIKKFNDIERELEEEKMKKVGQNKHTDKKLLPFVNLMFEEIRQEKLSTFREKRRLIDSIIDLEPKEIAKIVKDMYSLHQFILKHWNKASYSSLDVHAKIMLSFLKSINHERVVPVLFKFKDDNRMKDAVKACTAFTCLWRGYHASGGTDRIDAQYEEIIKKIYQENNSTITSLKNLMVNYLKNREGGPGHLNKEVWVNRFQSAEIYKSPKMARLLLFLAFDKREFDNNELVPSQKKFLTTDNWNENEYRTIEHIVPRQHNKIDLIGNLILLPQSVNSQVGVKNFAEKKEIYSNCLGSAPNDAPYLPVLKEITSYGEADIDGGYLSDSAIQSRGKKLGESIWQSLAVDILGWQE